MKIGIDLGGTNYRIGLLDDEYNLISLSKKVLTCKDGNEIIKSIINDLNEYDMNEIEGIGFCAPGIIDVKNCIMYASSNLDYENKIEIGKIFQSQFHKKIFIDNDANCAGLAESKLGAGKDKSSTYYITHSTGIGAAYIIDGQIIHGAHNCLGEIGACLLNKKPKIRLENSSAGPAIAKKGLDINLSTSEKVFMEAKNGNEKALNIIEEVFDNMAFVLANISYIADPDCFVLGGGISNNFDFYYPILMKYYKHYAKDAYENIPVLKANLQEPGVVGASLLIK